MEKKYSFERLIEIMEILRGENGCPWDREQTHESIKYDTIEETYELVEAINNKDDANIVEEIGDLLLHVVFHTKIGEDEGRFTMEDVLKSIIDKMIRRHPHIFEDERAANSEEVLKRWDEIKIVEKGIQTHTENLKGVPKAMPALIRAHKVQKKAAKIGFDFENIKQLLDKLHEEIEEVQEAISSKNIIRIEDELGDLLFQTVNITRFFELNAEKTLTNATEKFINRFEGIEELASAKGIKLDDLSLTQMDKLWDEVKQTMK